MKYIQSFYQYPVTFSSIGKTIPARAAKGDMRNLAEIEDKELDTLQNAEPLFRSLVSRKKYRILNKMPEGYKPAAAQINEARAENEALRARIAELEEAKGADTSGNEVSGDSGAAGDSPDVDAMSYAELQEMAKELGIEYKNVKKSDLIERIKAAGK